MAKGTPVIGQKGPKVPRFFAKGTPVIGQRYPGSLLKMAKGTPVIGQRYPGNCKGTPEVYKGTPEVLRLALAAVYSRICSQNQTWIAYFLGENSTQNS